ncbi:MAG: ATP-dependent dethiobiotin synthetase BioD [Acidimicrobiales bacterium]
MLGTATEVGKTWVTADLASRLRSRCMGVAARKPVQSFDPADEGGTATDAHALAASTGEDPAEVCPRHRWYEVAMAPPMAAEALGRPPFTVADLHGEITWPAGVDVGLVETVGGPRSPLASDGDSAALANALAPDLLVLVADAGLGAVNAVRLAAAALAGSPLVVHLNRFDADNTIHHANRSWLEGDGYRLTIEGATLAAWVAATRPAAGRR